MEIRKKYGRPMKSAIGNDFQPWMGNPTRKTHRGKDGDDVQDNIRPYGHLSYIFSSSSHSQYTRELHALPTTIL